MNTVSSIECVWQVEFCRGVELDYSVHSVKCSISYCAFISNSSCVESCRLPAPWASDNVWAQSTWTTVCLRDVRGTFKYNAVGTTPRWSWTCIWSDISQRLNMWRCCCAEVFRERQTSWRCVWVYISVNVCRREIITDYMHVWAHLCTHTSSNRS